MKETVKIENWSLSYIPNEWVCEKGIVLKKPADVRKGKYPTIAASVPGNYELDFMRAGLLEDVYVGANSVKTQELENLHFYYFTEFQYEAKSDKDAFLVFGGIDTVAEIYLDGKQIAFVENMLHEHRFSLKGVKSGKHTLLVHILPITIYSRQFEVPAMCWAMKYNQDGINVRKPGSMFGWDIMPRLVSAGLWKPVTIEYLPKARLEDVFTYTGRLGHGNKALIVTTMKIETEADFITDYKIVVKGQCGDSVFEKEFKPYCASVKIEFWMDNPKFWWPKNYGDPNLYDMEATLYYKGVECDKVTYRFGVRTIWLKRTSRAGDDGEFCFYINDKKIFVMGTNWVPTDAFPSRYDDYVLRDIEMVNELGCNMIRCWGGGAYPSNLLYDYCDEHGIMIWQDFSLACGHYPDNERLCALMAEEVRHVVKEKRNHPALVVWAGDNECDAFIATGYSESHSDDVPNAMIDPNLNKLTREVIKRELRNHDATRPYLPSSPYVDDLAYRYGLPSEEHLWGPRDFFKTDFYGKAQCHFASEIGYHGSPSPESIKKFIPKESLPQKSMYDICENPDWLIHAAGMETCVEGNPYSYRLPLMISQVERLFGSASTDLDTFARQSQISQAEAFKYFIECFRAKKWRRTGILWWNIIDGWPQVSDAVVDWYGCKKLAYSYIKRSQSAFCLFCDEPEDGMLDLIATNDLQVAVNATYTVTNLLTDEVVCEGSVSLDANGIARIAKLPDVKNAFYLISWSSAQGDGKNHFACSAKEGWDYETHIACLKKAGFYDEFEGF